MDDVLEQSPNTSGYTMNTLSVLVINLDRSKERCSMMKFQLDRLGLEYDFVNATDGGALSRQERERVESQRDVSIYGKPFTNGEIGCMYSHMESYNIILARDRPMLILEDDIFLTSRVREFLSQNVIDSLPTDWDIILLAYVQRGNVESRPSKRAIMSYWNRKKLPMGFLVGKPVQFCYHAAAYLVSVSGAQKLKSAGTPLRMPADILTGNSQEYGINMYVISKPIARQHHEIALHSTIKVDVQDATQAFYLQQDIKGTLAQVLIKPMYFCKRILSFCLNKFLLFVRGHAGIMVFLRKLGLIRRGLFMTEEPLHK